VRPRPLDLVWLALLAATGLSWWLGASGALAAGRWGMAALVLALAWLKGLGVLLEFMELRRAPRGWRWALAGGFSAIVALLLLATALA
jgi:hypothetical protein